MHQPLEHHWKAVKRTLCYLKGTLNHGLYLNAGKNLDLRGYSDANWTCDQND